MQASRSIARKRELISFWHNIFLLEDFGDDDYERYFGEHKILICHK